MKTKTFSFRLFMLCLGLIFAATIQAGGVNKHSHESDVSHQESNNSQESSKDAQDIDDVPTGKGWGMPRFGAAGRVTTAAVSQNGINYHGGPVMGVSTPPNVYFIWYGNWSGNTATTILPNVVRSIGGSSRYNIETTYTDGNSNPVKNAITYVKSVNDNYSQGAQVNGTAPLTDKGVFNVVSKALNSKSLPLDANGVYFVLTSQDVNENSGFCTNYCGWHSYGTFNRIPVKVAYVGNPARCPSACAKQTTFSPNGNIGADGMVSVLVHELEEAVTDPQLNAWYDSTGKENADKCAWTFGTTYPAANGSYYNVKLDAQEYLIQQNWVNAGGGSCASAY